MSAGKAGQGNAEIVAFCLKNKMDHTSLESLGGNITMWNIIPLSFLLHVFISKATYYLNFYLFMFIHSNGDTEKGERVETKRF